MTPDTQTDFDFVRQILAADMTVLPNTVPLPALLSKLAFCPVAGCVYELVQEVRCLRAHQAILASQTAEIEAARECLRLNLEFQEWAQGYLDSARWTGHDRSDAIKVELLERDQALLLRTTERDDARKEIVNVDTTARELLDNARAQIAGLRALLGKVHTLLLPWIDKAIGRPGTVTFQEWGDLFDRIEHVVAHPAEALRLPGQAHPPEWQPIETAPKDGTWILVTGCNTSPLVLVAGYREEKQLWQAPGRWVTYGFVTVKDPTHWMPLPAPLSADAPPAPLGQAQEPIRTGIALITQERERQVSVEAWTPEHDDRHRLHELLDAARCYINETIHPQVNPRPFWPWEMSWWKPSADPIRNLVKAGALIAAEIDRLQRAAVSAGVIALPSPQKEKET